MRLLAYLLIFTFAQNLTMKVQPADLRVPTVETAQTGFDYFHRRSEALYDRGNGTWGYEKYRSAIALRDVAWRVQGYLALSQTKAAEASLYRQRAVEGLNYLLTTQQRSGLFPFPALSIDHHKWGRQMARLIQACPRCIEGEWVVETPPEDQGLQYDNGVVGVALIEGYEVLRDRRYLAAAERAAQWALTQPLSRNVNYNSFSIRLLARVYALTGNQKYLDDAVRRTREAVFPTQTETGRWADAHNARLVYHNIITDGLVCLSHVLPKGHPFGNQLKERLERAVRLMIEIGLNGDGLSPVGDAASMGIAVLSDLSATRALNAQEKQLMHLFANAYLNHVSEFEKLADVEQRELMASRFMLGKYIAWRLKEEGLAPIR